MSVQNFGFADQNRWRYRLVNRSLFPGGEDYDYEYGQWVAVEVNEMGGMEGLSKTHGVPLSQAFSLCHPSEAPPLLSRLPDEQGV